MIFRTDYDTKQNNGQHVLTGIQAWYNVKIDEILMGDKNWKRNGLLKEIAKDNAGLHQKQQEGSD